MQMTPQKKLVTSVAAAALLLGLAACDNGDGDAAADESNDQAAVEQPHEDEGEGPVPEEQEMAEPELDDVPDVVAEVNGEEITGDEFSSAYETQYANSAMEAQMSGQEVDEEALQEQTLNNLVGYELMTQEAEDKGYEASEEDVEAELESVAQDNGLASVDELLEMAEEQGIDEDQLRDDVEQQVLINKVVDDLDVEEPSDEEVEAAYEEFAAAQQAPEGADAEEAETPDLEELRPEIEQQLAAEKENQAVMEHIEELREDAEVEIHV